jgi:hypothetical protein
MGGTMCAENVLISNSRNGLEVKKMLPYYGKLKPLIGVEGYIETEQGSKINREMNKTNLIWNLIKLGSIIITVIFTIMTLGAKGSTAFGKVFSFVLNLAILLVILRIPYKIISGKSKKKFNVEHMQHTKNIIDVIRPMFKAQHCVQPNGNIIVVGKDVFCFIDSINGNVVGYNKSNITKVDFTHVHVGSTTVSDSVTSGEVYNVRDGRGDFSGTTRTVSNTKNQFEWRLDIYSNFIQKPHHLFIFPEEEEKTAKETYALLMAQGE